MKGEAAERSVGGGEGSSHRSRRGGCRGGTGGGGVEGDQEELQPRGHELQHRSLRDSAPAPSEGGWEGGAQTPPGSPRPPRLLVITPAVFVCRGSLGARRRSVIMEKIIKTRRGDNSHLHIVRSGKFSF